MLGTHKKICHQASRGKNCEENECTWRSCLGFAGPSPLDSISCSVLVTTAISKLKGRRGANLEIKFSKTNQDDIGNIPGDLEDSFGLKSMLLDMPVPFRRDYSSGYELALVNICLCKEFFLQLPQSCVIVKSSPGEAAGMSMSKWFGRTELLLFVAISILVMLSGCETVFFAYFRKG